MSSGGADILQLEFGTTMQRMSETLEQLRLAIVTLESQRQESVTGEIKGLLESVEKSIVQALEKMGSDFHEALSGAANRELRKRSRHARSHAADAVGHERTVWVDAGGIRGNRSKGRRDYIGPLRA